MPHSIVPRLWRTWLLDPGSLTMKLKSSGEFKVRVLNASFCRCTQSEAKALRINSRQNVYVREVALCVDQLPIAYARSIIPRNTLLGATRQLLFLENKSIGEFLFSHNSMRRGSIQVKRGLVNNEPTWARRSVFKLNQKPLLISEYFINSVLKL
jgi:chorismate--pyruvate lyase